MDRLIGSYIKSDGTIVAFEKTTDTVDLKQYGIEAQGQEQIKELEFLAKEFPNLIHRTETRL